MAVKIPNHLYFANYKRETITFFALTQMLSALIAGAVAVTIWEFLRLDPLTAFTIGLIVLVVTNLAASVVLFKIAAMPFSLLAQAVAHVSKDPVVTPPPIVDGKKYEYSGLKAMVQTVYELAVAAQQSSPSGAVAQPQSAFQELLQNMPCGVVALDKSGAVLYANTLAPVKALPDGGQALTLLFEQRDTLSNWIADCEANKVRDTHTWQRVADKLPGESGQRIFDIAAYYQKGGPSGIAVVLVAFDRTGIYQPDQDDMDFIALAAHELRGPITVIRGYLDIAEQELGQSLSAEQHELFDRLKVASERLAGYVSNILNVSRYDRKQFAMHLQEERLTDIIATLTPDLELRAKTQHRALVFNIPPDLPTVAADRSSIGEVITNLVDNGIKYSHEGGQVTIGAAVKKDDQMVEITVQDAGIGMPESVVGGLFNKFYRSHRSRQSVGGTGLGLYICKAIVESHGGSIWVSSHEGQGSTFGFTVPIYASVAAKLQAGDNQNKDIVQRPEGWIKNHAMYRR